jgi:hypothetical protein
MSSFLAADAFARERAGLYLPGGYPELAARELSANAAMRAAVRAFCASGGPVWAECGGYMYLLEELDDGQGGRWPMCAALPGRAVLRQRRAALGYRAARTLVPGPFGSGTSVRGHEFHYSEYEGTPRPGLRPGGLPGRRGCGRPGPGRRGGRIFPRAPGLQSADCTGLCGRLPGLARRRGLVAVSRLCPALRQPSAADAKSQRVSPLAP